jgi:hypothetical protein
MRSVLCVLALAATWAASNGEQVEVDALGEVVGGEQLPSVATLAPLEEDVVFFEGFQDETHVSCLGLAR